MSGHEETHFGVFIGESEGLLINLNPSKISGRAAQRWVPGVLACVDVH